MQCFYHIGNAAVSACKTCNKGLCRECTNEEGCIDCLIKQHDGEVRVYKRKLLISAILFGLGITIGIWDMLTYHEFTFFSMFGFAIFANCFYWGFSAYPSAPSWVFDVNPEAATRSILWKVVLAPFFGLILAPLGLFTAFLQVRTSGYRKQQLLNLKQET
jgi:hypothetical protein